MRSCSLTSVADSILNTRSESGHLFVFESSLENRRIEEQRAPICAKADNEASFVRHLPRGFGRSGMKVTVEQSEDRRIHKTKRLLREALFSLIGEKDYDSIVVKEILDRADVGRSTFYAHFNDKDELLVSGIHDLINSVQATELPRTAKPYEQMIRFSLPLLERIDQHRFSLPVLERIDRHRHTDAVRIGTRGRAI